MPNINTFVAQGLSNAPAQYQSSPAWQVGRGSTGNPTTLIDSASRGYRGGSRLQFPSDQGKYYLTLTISRYSRQSLTSVGQLSPYQSISLPLPLNLKDIHTEEYREYEYGMIAGGMAEIMGLRTPEGQIATGVGMAAGSFASGVMGSLGLPSSGDAAVVRAGAGLAGYAPNMFQTVLFKGPRFKQPKLSFTLCPKTARESQTIRDIIAMLNNAMAPRFGATFGSLLFEFPDIFQIAYNPNAGYLYKFKPAVLEQIQVNYAGGGNHVAFYREEGAPESVEIDLAFRELEYWVNGDFNTDNQPTSSERVNNAAPPLPAGLQENIQSSVNYVSEQVSQVAGAGQFVGDATRRALGR